MGKDDDPYVTLGKGILNILGIIVVYVFPMIQLSRIVIYLASIHRPFGEASPLCYDEICEVLEANIDAQNLIVNIELTYRHVTDRNIIAYGPFRSEEDAYCFMNRSVETGRVECAMSANIATDPVCPPPVHFDPNSIIFITGWIILIVTNIWQDSGPTKIRPGSMAEVIAITVLSLCGIIFVILGLSDVNNNADIKESCEWAVCYIDNYFLPTYASDGYATFMYVSDLETDRVGVFASGRSRTSNDNVEYVNFQIDNGFPCVANPYALSHDCPRNPAWVEKNIDDAIFTHFFIWIKIIYLAAAWFTYSSYHRKLVDATTTSSPTHTSYHAPYLSTDHPTEASIPSAPHISLYESNHKY